MILTYSPEDWPLFKKVMESVIPANELLDIGAGIRPQRLVPCNRHVCVEPHGEYADILESAGYEVIRKNAIEALNDCEPVDTIIALDVIEHMEKDDGIEFCRLALQKARQQFIVFTPLGFVQQDGGDKCDPWGFQGMEWQKHRSGWVPADFQGYDFLIDEKFDGHGAFFAIYRKD